MTDVNGDVLEQADAYAEPSKVCAGCGGKFYTLTDGWCRACLKIGAWSPKYLRADYRYRITVPASGQLCSCNGRLNHTHPELEPAVFKFVTRAGALEAARVYSALSGTVIEVEELCPSLK